MGTNRVISSIVTAAVATAVMFGAAACQPARPVLVVGDSLLFYSQPQHDQMWGRHQAAATWVGGPGQSPINRSSTWRADIARTVNTLDPAVVVYEACCNYANGSDDELLPGVARDSDAMFTAWETAVRADLGAAHARGATVWLVKSPPPVPGSLYDYFGFGTRVRRINTIYDRIAADTSWVRLVDWSSWFSVNGTPVTTHPFFGRLRTPDGLHFQDGGHPLSVAVLEHAVYP
ncbi:MAG: hypothetical protein R2726_06750 [Acidimicrobiales bacterium]